MGDRKVRSHWLDTMGQAMTEPLAQPNAAGIWNFKGYVNFARGVDPNRIERMAVRVFWGLATQGWHTVDKYGGRRPANMLIGKWMRRE